MGVCSSGEQNEAAVPSIDADDISTPDSQPFVTALARGLAVIRAFGRDRAESTLTDLAKATELPRATVRRCVHTLVGLGYAQSDGRHFSLTPKILTLGYAYLSTAPLPRVAQPSWNASAKVAMNRAPSRFSRAMRSSTWLGRRASDHVGRTSRWGHSCLRTARRWACLLAAFLRTRCATVWRAQSCSDSRLTRSFDPDALREILNGVRRQGFAIVDQELRNRAAFSRRSGLRGRRQGRGCDERERSGGRVDIVQLRGPLLDSLRLGVAELSACWRPLTFGPR